MPTRYWSKYWGTTSATYHMSEDKKLCVKLGALRSRRQPETLDVKRFMEEMEGGLADRQWCRPGPRGTLGRKDGWMDDFLDRGIGLRIFGKADANLLGQSFPLNPRNQPAWVSLLQLAFDLEQPVRAGLCKEPCWWTSEYRSRGISQLCFP